MDHYHSCTAYRDVVSNSTGQTGNTCNYSQSAVESPHCDQQLIINIIDIVDILEMEPWKPGAIVASTVSTGRISTTNSLCGFRRVAMKVISAATFPSASACYLRRSTRRALRWEMVHPNAQWQKCPSVHASF